MKFKKNHIQTIPPFKNIIGFIIIVFYSINLSAMDQLPENKGVNIQIIDQALKTETLEIQYIVKRAPKVYKSLPNLKDRNMLLISPLFATWDEVEKDILYFDLKTKSISALLEKYPEVPSKELRQLRNKAR